MSLPILLRRCVPLIAAAAVLPIGCRPPGQARREQPTAHPFTEVAATARISFRHNHGGRSPLSILESAGAGCAFVDYDQDGDLDVFLVNGCDPRMPAGIRKPRHALYRNNGNGTFSDVSAGAGFTDRLYGMGCAAADYDGDGFPDLLVTGYEGVALYRNRHGGTWEEVTARSGLREPGWRTSAAFADVNGDGWLDLYVCGYVRFGPGTPRNCPVRGIQVACPPYTYQGDPGSLYLNNGNGTFTNVTRTASAPAPDGHSLGCLFLDYDGDGRQDLYVANDGIANCLFHNLTRPGGPPRFKDEALYVNAAYGEAGSGEASMGVDAADYDGDGRLDLFVTNFQDETDALYHNLPGGQFDYATRSTGLDSTRHSLSFGCGFFDYDNDADPDLFIASGHVHDLAQQLDPAWSFAQPRHLYENSGGRFRNVEGGAALSTPAVGRGAAFGDYDNDGDTDVLVSNNGGPAMLLRNEVGARRRWLRVRLAGRRPNRFAIGARVTVSAAGRDQVQEVRAGNSYASSSDPRLLFGLGDAAGARVRVRWPDGKEQSLDSPAVNREVLVREGGG